MYNYKYDQIKKELKEETENLKATKEFLKVLRYNTKKDGKPFHNIKKNFNFEGWNDTAYINITDYSVDRNRIEISFWKGLKNYNIYFYNFKNFEDLKEMIKIKHENIDESIYEAECKEKNIDKMLEETETFRKNMCDKYPDVKKYLQELFRGFCI